MTAQDIMPLGAEVLPPDGEGLGKIASAIAKARLSDRAVVMLMGAHVIKQGLARFLIRMIEEGMITHLGTNGAGAIHDFETAMIGSTTESVAKYIFEGQFGLWKETGGLNDVAVMARKEQIGFGEMLGRTIQEGDFPRKDLSIFAAGYRAKVPCTVHVAIGQDIVHEHPNCDGEAIGWASYRDFLVFTQSVSRLEGGVFLNYGTAVMGPEVYLKALSMVRNVARPKGEDIRHFTTGVFDLAPLPDDMEKEPKKTEFAYYYRPLKTVLIRTVRDGGTSYYIRADHRHSVPNLYRMVRGEMDA